MTSFKQPLNIFVVELFGIESTSSDVSICERNENKSEFSFQYEDGAVWTIYQEKLLNLIERN